MDEYLPHVFGLIGLICIVAAWQFNVRRTMLILNICAFLAFATELYLLGAFVGSIMMVTAAVKVTAAMYTQNKWVVAGFIVVPLIYSSFYYAHWYDILTMIAHVTGALSFFSKSVRNMRILAPIGTILWAVHNIVVGAWAQLLADIFILTSMTIGALRHRKSFNKT